MSFPTRPLTVLLGTSANTRGVARGVFRTQLDPATGALSAPELAAETPNPGFLCLHPAGRHVYCSGEDGMTDHKSAAGAACAYACDNLGQLTFLNKRPTGGMPITHLVADATGRSLFTAGFHGSQVAAFPIAADGQLSPRSTSIVLTGQLGPNKARQDKPHPHSVTLAPDNRHLYVCDLGLDRIFCYTVDTTEGTLQLAGEFVAAPGSGPRHSKFSADGRFFYVITELANTIAVYSCEPVSGALSLQQTVSTLPAGFSGESITAEIRLHPNGRFVYGANRGHDSIAVFARDAASGQLTHVETVSCGGRHPRNFALSADGAWLVCAGRDTNDLASFRVDAASGRISPVGHVTGVPSPTCVLFV